MGFFSMMQVGATTYQFKTGRDARMGCFQVGDVLDEELDAEHGDYVVDGLGDDKTYAVIFIKDRVVVDVLEVFDLHEDPKFTLELVDMIARGHRLTRACYALELAHANYQTIFIENI